MQADDEEKEEAEEEEEEEEGAVASTAGTSANTPRATARHAVETPWPASWTICRGNAGPQQKQTSGRLRILAVAAAGARGEGDAPKGGGRRSKTGHARDGTAPCWRWLTRAASAARCPGLSRAALRELRAEQLTRDCRRSWARFASRRPGGGGGGSAQGGQQGRKGAVRTRSGRGLARS
ncbi:unnamed protein product [Prorocentrum cordatum]|uniref:Uncharacterized protein n=1 Tax=Prorocentrum cordatum TaxID=2364126 RepID=A0ABN9VDJ2_9DINO|nr:unnamed protein product [Polarella glacialis]